MPRVPVWKWQSKETNQQTQIKEKSMVEPRITAKIDLSEFQKLVFQSKASFLCSLIISPESLGYSHRMSLEEAINIREKFLDIWWLTISPSSIGQYTLMKQNSACLLTRLDIYFRPATEEEASIDIETERQTMEKRIRNGAPIDKTTFPFIGSRFICDGPPKIIIINLFVRGGIGPVPNKKEVQDMAAQIDEVAEDNMNTLRAETIITEAYFLIFAKEGQMCTSQFRNPREYNNYRYQPLGRMKLKNGRLLFLHHGKGRNPIDFSGLIFRNQETTLKWQ